MKSISLLLSSTIFLIPAGTVFSQEATEPDPFASLPSTSPEAPARIDEQTAKKHFKDFAKVYWHAEDKVIKGLKYGGASGDPGTFSDQTRIEFLKFEELNGGSVLTFAMKQRRDPERTWEFEFSYFESGWKPTRGWETTDGKRQDLYKRSLMVPIPYQRLLQIELDQCLKGEGRYGKIVRKEAGIQTPTYSCLTTEGGHSGAAFHFEWKGKRFIASIKEGNYRRKDPETFVSTAFDKPIAAKRTIHEMMFFFLIHEYESAALDKVTPLTFEAEETLKLDDPMFVNNGEEWILGHVVTADEAVVRIELTRPIRNPDRMNGSPIINGLSGTVAGILYADPDQEPVKAVDAARLRLPHFLSEAPDSDSVPDRIFGIKREDAVPPDLAKYVLKNLIYPEVLKVSLGMTEDRLRVTRPGLPRDFYHEKFTHGYQFDSATYFLDRRSRNVERISLGNYGGNESMDDQRPKNLIRFFEFVSAYFGAPDQTFLQGDQEGPPDPDQLAFFWSTDAYSMAWTIDSDFNSAISLVAGRKNPGEMIAMKRIPTAQLEVPPDAPTERQAIILFLRKWAGELEETSK